MVNKLVLNSEPAKEGTLQKMVCNLLPKQVRIDSMEGREFIVVPMVILTEGVHSGSSGPMLYPKDELSKTPVVWNHKPIVVYHPEMNGQGISACDPSVITNRKVGVMMNTMFEGGRLKSEAWIEKSRADLVDNRIMEAIEKNEMMELSTGVYVDEDPTSGDWSGESYAAIARNYRPDHLALLPDKIGACSIADGAGFLRNEGKEKNPIAKALQRVLQRMGLVENELSHSNLRENLAMQLRKRFNADPVSSSTTPGPMLWVEDVYSNFVIYELNNKLFRIGYTANDTGVTLSEDAPIEVIRVTEYRSTTGSFIGNHNPTEITINMKKQLIDGLIANTASGFTEASRVALETMTEAQLTAVANSFKPATPPAVVPPAVVPPATPAVTNVVPIPAPAPVALTAQQYVQNAPKEIQDVLSNGLQVYAEEKTKLVTEILANKNNPFAKEDLENRPLGDLRNLARLAGASAPAPANINFGGQGATPTGNEGAEEAMEMPTINFAAAK